MDRPPARRVRWSKRLSLRRKNTRMQAIFEETEREPLIQPPLTDTPEAKNSSDSDSDIVCPTISPDIDILVPESDDSNDGVGSRIRRLFRMPPQSQGYTTFVMDTDDSDDDSEPQGPSTCETGVQTEVDLTMDFYVADLILPEEDCVSRDNDLRMGYHSVITQTVASGHIIPYWNERQRILLVAVNV